MDQESQMIPCDEFDRSPSLVMAGGQRRSRNQGRLATLAALVATASLLPLLGIALSAAPEKAPLEDHGSEDGSHRVDEKGLTREVERKIEMHGRSLELHLAHSQEALPPNVLLLYASGDGGWFGEAVKMFEDLTHLGYPAVGFSTRSYMKILGYGDDPVSVDELGKDYDEIIREAEASLHLPKTTRTILIGWSRGAAFAVLVGSEKKFQNQLAGVIAIGLPDKEELKIRIHDKRILVANVSSKRHIIFDTYQRIPLIAPLPFSLIQSTGDDFLPAAEAKKLFGSESETDKFFAVEAHNHRFSGGSAAFSESLRESVSWIAKRISTSPESH
jgi:Bacterial virulence protein (VirJ)